jgi:hypothetical protein
MPDVRAEAGKHLVVGRVFGRYAACYRNPCESRGAAQAQVTVGSSISSTGIDSPHSVQTTVVPSL